MSMESHGGMILTGENQSIRRKICSSSTLSTKNPTLTELRSNPDLRGEIIELHQEEFQKQVSRFMTKEVLETSFIIFKNSA
jgi:hypothetical protein